MRLFSLNKIVFAVALISFSISVTAKDLATSSKSVDENSILESLGSSTVRFLEKLLKY